MDQYQVFISCKSQDKTLGEEVYSSLKEFGFNVFFSTVTLEEGGVSEFKQSIDKALEEASVMVVVGTSRAHLEARWVHYEWDTFQEEILNGQKPEGKIFTYVNGMEIKELPIGLRRCEMFQHGPEELERLSRFVNNALKVKEKSADGAESNQLTLTLARGVEMVFLRVPAGEFLMGSDKKKDTDARSDELPQHKVYLDEYWMGKCPVTVAQFSAFVQASRYSFKIELDVQGKGRHPANWLNWKDACAFCEWASSVAGRKIRLPSEAEWEKAARGTDGRIYPWGHAAPDQSLLNFNQNKESTTEVGSYPSGASPYGALDMAGNVSEWVYDWYSDSYYQQSPPRNPTGPTSGTSRVLRGSSWKDAVKYVRSASRDWSTPDVRNLSVGFRCAASA